MRSRFVLLALVGVLAFRFAVQEEGGNRAYRDGEYAEAAERYRRALAEGEGDPRVHYNLGTALLNLGELEDARGELTEALQGRSPDLRTSAFYNLGNARARASGSSEGESSEHLRSAIEAYRRSLMLDSGAADARWNLELATRRLQRLEERQRSMPGDQEQPRTRPREDESREDGGADPDRAPAGAPTPGEAPDSELRDAASAPLPPELAEQILRAVEEQERGLQRERLRRQSPSRRSGPDW